MEKPPKPPVKARRQRVAPSQPPALKIPDQFDPQTLNSALASRLAGTPADGSPAKVNSARSVIWVEKGDEVLVHLDAIHTQILDGMLLVSVDLETDQTGRTPLVLALALGKANDPAGLVAVTDDLPRGNGLLASRWGKILQDAVWASLIALANEHAAERGLAPHGLLLSEGTLRLHAAAPIAISIRSRGKR